MGTPTAPLKLSTPTGANRLFLTMAAVNRFAKRQLKERAESYILSDFAVALIRTVLEEIGDHMPTYRQDVLSTSPAVLILPTA